MGRSWCCTNLKISQETRSSSSGEDAWDMSCFDLDQPAIRPTRDDVADATMYGVNERDGTSRRE